MKKLLLTLVGIVCSLGMSWADDFGFSTTSLTVAPTVTTHSDPAITVAFARGSQNTGTSKGDFYWGSTTKETYAGTAERTKLSNSYFAEFKDDAWTGATITIPTGYQINATKLYYEIAGQDYKWHYKASIINGDGTVVLAQSDKGGSSPKSSSKLTVTENLSDVVLSGNVTIKIFWYGEVTSDSKYMAVPILTLTGTVETAAAQTQYTKPTLTIGAYDQPSGTYPVTLAVQNDENGTINYTMGSNDKVTGVESGTVVNVPANTTITATVSGDTYDESAEASATMANKPQLASPTVTLGSYDIDKNVYTVSLSAATGAKIIYTTDDWTTYPTYSEAFTVVPGTVIKAQAQQNNMQTSENVEYTVPAAPCDGTYATPTTSGTYTDGQVYDAGAFYIPNDQAYIGGQISSGNSSINGAIKMRISRQADSNDFSSVYGFHIHANAGYTLNSVTLQMLNNYDTAVKLVGVYADDATTTNLLADAVTLPYASASSVEAVTVELTDLAVTDRLVFVFEGDGTNNPNQAQVIITAKAGVSAKKTLGNAGTMGLSTLCAPQNFKISGATAYKAAISDDVVKLTALSGVIAAGTGVVVAGEKGATYTVAYTSEEATADVTGNELVGTTERKATVDNTYALNSTTGEFQSYAGSYFPACKAYLTLTSGAKKIVFADETTSIKSVETCDGEGVAYNLAGQRVAAGQKGLVIMNGKKYINK